MKAYRARLDEFESDLGPRPADDERWTSRTLDDWFMLDWNAQRLAVLDHDIDAIIRTHARGPAGRGLGGGHCARPSRRSARSTSPSTGRSRPPTSTAATSRSRQPTTGAASSTSTGPPKHWRHGCWCSGAGRRPRRPHGYTRLRARLAGFPRRGRGHAGGEPERRGVVRAAHPRRTPSSPGVSPTPSPSTATPHGATLAKVYEKVDPLAVLPIHQRLVEQRTRRSRRPALPARRPTAGEDAQTRCWAATSSRGR